MNTRALQRHAAFLTPNRAWLAIFGVWTLLLSGVFADFVGTPGLVQWRKLEDLYSSKQVDQERLEFDLARLQKEIYEMEREPDVQRREIRRLLGYVAADEVIFEFPDVVPDQE